MNTRTILFFIVIALAALPLTFTGKIQSGHADPLRMARYYDSLAMPDSALHWLEKINARKLSPDAKIRHYLLKAGQLRQLKRGAEAWAYHDSIIAMLNETSVYPNVAAETEFLRGRLLYDNGDYFDAKKSFDLAERLMQGDLSFDTGLFIRILNFKGIANMYLGELSLASAALKGAEETALKSARINLLDFSDVLQNLAIVYSNMSLFDSAYIYIVKSREIKETILRNDNPSLITFYVNYGRVLQMTGRIEESLKYFSKVDELIELNSGLHQIKGTLYNNLGNSYQLTGDYDRAIQYFQSAYGHLSQSQGNAHLNTLTALNNLAFMYNRTAQHDSALRILYRLQQSQLTPLLEIRVSRNLATTYRSLRKFDEALINISKCISTAEYYLGNRHFEYAYSVFEKARIGIAMNDFNLALSSISEAEQAYAVIFHSTDEEYINILRIKAFIKSRLLKFEEAEAIFSKVDSLMNLVKENETLPENGMSRYLSFNYANVLIDKARMYQEWYAFNKDIQNLAASVDLYSRSLSIYEQYSQFATDESRLLLGDDMRGTYQDAVRAAWELFTIRGEQNNLDLAYGFAGRAKSSVLLSSIRKLRAFEAAGVPTQTTETERRLRLEIHALTRAASDERLRPQPNNARIAILDAKRIVLTRSYDSLMQQIETKYPDYYALRYAPATLTIQQVQKNLSPDQVLIDYFIESNHLYIFALRSDSTLLLKNALPDRLETGVDSLRHIILTNLMSHSFADYQAFLGISTSLYSELIKPIEGFIQGRRLVIVPDGVLGYLPFDLLIDPEKLTSEQRETFNYAQLPFLLYDFPLSYLSSSALVKDFEVDPGRKAGQVLAMAPDYSKPSVSGKLNYSPLPYASKEAEMVRNIWGGLVLSGSDATKKAFIETAPKYGLLHLAMHTLLDDENPLYSKLVFHPDDSVANEMFGYELYALRFKAAIVVLSACNSGLGKLRSAEGVMSLSRAFIYAGVPSVVMTGWEVNDQSGARLMEFFYRNLAKGLTKDRALQQAKIAWLLESNQFKSHPFFWAAYQMLGDTQSIKKKTSYQLLIIIPIGMLVISIVLLVVRRRGMFTFASKA